MPITLKTTIIPVTEKIVNLLFKEIEPSIDVILEFCSFFKDMFPVEVKFRRVGSNVKVMIGKMKKIQTMKSIGLQKIK